MINWHKSPFIRIIIPFVLGILFSFQLYSVENAYLFIVIIFLVGALFLLKAKKEGLYTSSFGIVLNAVVFLLGLFVTNYHHQKNGFQTENEVEKIHYYHCSVLEPIKEKPNSYQVVVKLNGCYTNNSWEGISANAILYLEKDSSSKSLLIGNELVLKAHLNTVSSPKNPGEFDFSIYLKNKGIYQQGYFSSKDWIIQSVETGGLYVYANFARDYLLNTLKINGVEGGQFAIASALLLGSKDELDFEAKQAYAAAGAMHVLAVSGLHVGIVFLILNTFFSFLNKIKRGSIIKAILLIFCLWLYALITGLSPSVLRAATMFSFVIVGSALNRNSSIYNTLAASAFFLLFINPNLLFEVGFQLSYIAVLGIVYLQPLIYKRISTRWWLLDKIWAITAVSIAAQIATLPLTLYYFHQFPVYFMISNLIVIPAAIVTLCLGILLFITSPIPPISESIGWLLNNTIKGLNYGVKEIESLPNSVIDGISISLLECLFLYGIIFVFIIGIRKRKIAIVNWGLLLSVVFIVNDLLEDYQLSNSKSITIFHIKENQTIEFIDGFDNTLLTTMAIIDSKKKQAYHLKNHWAIRDLTRARFIAVNIPSIDTVVMNDKLQIVNEYTQFYNKKMIRINPDFRISAHDKKQKVDYILIGNNANQKLKNLYLQFDFKKVIVDGSNSKWNRNRIEEEALKLNIPFINTDNGALVENI